MKKLIVAIMISLSISGFSMPRAGRFRPRRVSHRPATYRVAPRPAPHHPVIHHRDHMHHSAYHPSWWLFPFMTGVLINEAVSRTPVVVQQPVPVVVQLNQVWVEGQYVEQVQPNGTVIRIWQPGHWEAVK